MNKETRKSRFSYNPYKVETPPFDAYSPESSLQDALGSNRTKRSNEQGYNSSTNFKEGSSGYRLTPNDIRNVPLIIVGTAAPTTTPSKIGNVFINETAKKIYFATGTSSSSDWTVVN